MSCLGVHIALTAEQEQDVWTHFYDETILDLVEALRADDDEEHRQRTDKAWDPIHRCLSDGTLVWDAGRWPLRGAILGSESLYFSGDFVVMLLERGEVVEVAGALDAVTQEWFRERFLAEVGHAALRRVRYVPERESQLPADLRTVFKGVLRDWEIPGSEKHPPLRLRVAYIHSSEEAAQVADARERALVKAEDALGRMRNGLGGRYYKTQAQVQRRIGQIIGVNITGLIDVTVTTRAGKLTVTWQRNHDAINTAAGFDGIYALATNLPGRITAGQVLRLYKDQQIVERRHRDLKQTLKVRPIFLHNDDRVYALLSIVGISPGCSQKAAPRNRPAATSSPPSKDSASPTPTPASNSTRSPTPNNTSSTYSESSRPGHNRQTMPSRTAENGASGGRRLLWC